MSNLSSVASNRWQLSLLSLSVAVGAAAVVETYVGMSRRCTVGEKVCVSCCHRVVFNTLGSGNILHALGRVSEVKGLALFTGLLIKVMVMMTLSAFLVEKHVA